MNKADKFHVNNVRDLYIEAEAAVYSALSRFLELYRNYRKTLNRLGPLYSDAGFDAEPFLVNLEGGNPFQKTMIWGYAKKRNVYESLKSAVRHKKVMKGVNKLRRRRSILDEWRETLGEERRHRRRQRLFGGIETDAFQEGGDNLEGDFHTEKVVYPTTGENG